MDVTRGALLGGRVRYDQPAEGHRTGIEPVLLAAAVGAWPGQRVLEAGTGAGAGVLCVLARCPGVIVSGVEVDAALAGLARANVAANGWEAAIHAGDVAGAPELGRFDHVFANPPWHDPAGTATPSAGRLLARHRGAGGLAAWIEPLAEALARGGVLTLALPASLVGVALRDLLGSGLGQVTVFPLWPRAGRAAKLALVRARRGAARTSLAAGLVLHGAGGTFTAEADGVLREGGGLTI